MEKKIIKKGYLCIAVKNTIWCLKRDTNTEHDFFSQTEEGTTIDIDLIIPLVLLIHATWNNIKELKLFESGLLLWVIVKTFIEEGPENLLPYEYKDILFISQIIWSFHYLKKFLLVENWVINSNKEKINTLIHFLRYFILIFICVLFDWNIQPVCFLRLTLVNQCCRLTKALH